MKAYFWARVKGTTINAEVYKFTPVAGGRPISITWRIALMSGAADELILILAPGAYRDAIHGAAWVKKSVKNITNPTTYGDAFLTIVDNDPKGNTRKKVKYRLSNISFPPQYSWNAESDPKCRLKKGTSPEGLGACSTILVHVCFSNIRETV